MSERCVASERRLRWAWLRATGDPTILRVDSSDRIFDLTMDAARFLAAEADIPTAALYLPDPSRWEMFKAWCVGVRKALAADRREANQ